MLSGAWSKHRRSKPSFASGIHSWSRAWQTSSGASHLQRQLPSPRHKHSQLASFKIEFAILFNVDEWSRGLILSPGRAALWRQTNACLPHMRSSGPRGRHLRRSCFGLQTLSMTPGDAANACC